MPPVNRFAAFKFKPNITPSQRQQGLDGIRKLYEANAERVLSQPKGGMNSSPEGYGKGFEFGFVVVFKDERARDDFNTDEAHLEFKNWMDEHIVEDAFLFDIVEGGHGF